MRRLAIRLSFGVAIVAVAAWGRPRVGASASSAPDGVVRLVRVPDGGIQPQVALDERGGVHLVYFRGDPAHGDAYYTRLDSAGTFAKAIRVNSQPGSAIATGNIRGAHVAIGRNGRVHVSWAGSDRAPRNPAGGTSMLYARSNAAATAFEPERNLAQVVRGLDSDAIAADAAGNVYVAWHGGTPDSASEATARLWVARSSDGGATFAREQPASEASAGACACCGVAAQTDGRGRLYLLYRSAAEVVHRDTFLLTSADHGGVFASTKLQEWNIGACPMSTYALANAPGGVLAAWETAGQVQFVRLDAAGRPRSAPIEAPGAARTRKHPALAGNARGDVVLVWTEGMGWERGGSVAWQVFDRDGRPTTDAGRRDGVPAWSLVAAYARPDGGFTILY